MKKLLVIDLSSKSVHEEQIDPDQARDFIGGSGLTARLLYDNLADDQYPDLIHCSLPCCSRLPQPSRAYLVLDVNRWSIIRPSRPLVLASRLIRNDPRPYLTLPDQILFLDPRLLNRLGRHQIVTTNKPYPSAHV